MKPEETYTKACVWDKGVNWNCVNNDYAEKVLRPIYEGVRGKEPRLTGQQIANIMVVVKKVNGKFVMEWTKEGKSILAEDKMKKHLQTLSKEAAEKITQEMFNEHAMDVLEQMALYRQMPFLMEDD